MHKFVTGIAFVLALVVFAPVAQAQPGMPPANVVVATVTSGTVAPERVFTGTVFYPEVSDVSAEISGTVRETTFEEGQVIRKDEVLVKLDSTILEKTLQSKIASHEQVLSDLEKARKNLERIGALYQREIVAEKDFDDQSFEVRGLEKKASAIRADVERLEIEIEKTAIRAPFTGIVIKKQAARGEWLSPGMTVATIARHDRVDVIADIPEDVIRYVRPAMKVKVSVAGRDLWGTVHAIIPRGDISTRTFPVKIKLDNLTSLMEGMQAQVRLPIGKRIKTLLVPRDAVLNMYGQTMVVAVVDAKAVTIPVKIVGYQGMKAGINSQGITEGMVVVIKGNERLRNGQPVQIMKDAAR